MQVPQAGARRAAPPWAEPARAERPLQPALHELVLGVAAPTVVVGATDGQVYADGAQGVFHGDVRVLSRAELTVGGWAPEGLSHGLHGAGGADFVGVVRQLGDAMPDPTLRIDRHREVSPGRVEERVTLVSTALTPISTTVGLALACDFAGIGEVKAGRRGSPVEAAYPGPALRWRRGDTVVELRTVEDHPSGANQDVERIELVWHLELPPGGRHTLAWTLTVTDPGGVVVEAPPVDPAPAPTVRADDRRLAELTDRSLADLAGLRMAPVRAPGDVFLAAGAPWYLTLFGRDSLWAARLLLPFGTELAAGTLRALAARQGTRVDPVTAEAPGKILHELRRADAAPGVVGSLPAVYYGTVDASALWACLLSDAWRWGLPPAQIEPLLDPLVRALDWITGPADSDGDGFLEYVDETGQGLANQGWKDSHDSIRFGNGRLADPPIALCEVQGYAHEAAVRGADLLDSFGRSGAAGYREWAAGLRDRFRAAFWTGSPAFPALALDGAKRPVDSVTSNAGHLLGTGLLDADEVDRVVTLMTAPEMDSGWGLRTMSTAAGGYRPLSYHCGSVWPHDTAIVLAGLAREGRGLAGRGLVEGLLAASAGWGGRFPELWAGDPRDGLSRPVPYPAACRPQAWSAASAAAVLTTLLGLRADVPAGRLTLAPVRPMPVGRLRVEGLRVGPDVLTVEVDAAGTVQEVSGTTLTVDLT